MALLQKDHYEMIGFFEKTFKGIGRFDKEDKSMWARGHIYQHGEVNKAFLMFRQGVAYGKSMAAE
jgi:hypothetical protein